MKAFIKEFKVEFVVFILAIFGALIWLDILGIRTLLASFFGTLLIKTGGIIQNFANNSLGFFSALTISDVIVFSVLLVASVFVVWRTRSRFLDSEFYISRECPKCGERLNRVHRRWFDHLISRVMFVSLHRYRCANPDCGWKGLRKPGRHHRRWDQQEEDFMRDHLSA